MLNQAPLGSLVSSGRSSFHAVMTQLTNVLIAGHDAPPCGAGELAFDGAAAGVRAAALEGLALLAQNPLAQPLLAALLPGLRCLLWDASAAVRIALAELLLSVGCARGQSPRVQGF